MPEVLDAGAAPEVESPTLEPVETPEVEPESPEVESPESEPSETPETDTEQEPESADGRRMPDKFKQYLKELRATDPRLARQLANEYHFAQQIRSTYPGGIKDIQRVAQIAETIGGEEGLHAIEAERAEWGKLDELYSTGDPQFIDKISAEDPQAFTKLVPHAMNVFAKLDPDGYSHVMAGIVVATVENMGDPRAIYDALASSENGKPLAEKFAAWFNNLDKIAREKPVPKVDPEREKLNAEKEAWEKQKADAFINEVRKNHQQFRSSTISNELSSQLTKMGKNAEAFKKQNPESFQILMQNCEQKALEMLTADTKWKEQYDAMVWSGNKEKAIHMHNAKLQQILRGDGQNKGAVARTLRAFLAFGGGTKAPVNGGARLAQPQAKTEVQVSKQPQPNELDWARMGSKGSEMILSGKAFIKGRKEMVRW